MSRALMKFAVQYAGIRIKVRVVPTAQDVYTELTGGARWRMRADLPMGFFQAAPDRASFTGTIVLAVNQDLSETIPHEVFHAVMHQKQTVHADSDEPAAYAIGVLSSRIRRCIARSYHIQ